jgi:hypothetical protein
VLPTAVTQYDIRFHLKTTKGLLMKFKQLLSCTLYAGLLPYLNTATAPLSALFTNPATRSIAASILTAIAISIAPAVSAQAIPGGFIETPGYSVRSTLSPNHIAQLLPERGRFDFPAPYNTTGIRLTNSNDCGGSDCVNYIGYSYWPNINNHSGQDSMLIFVGLERTEGGSGPSLYQYNKLTDKVDNLGPLFDSTHPLSWSSGEGWYFSATNPTALYVNDQQKLQRYDVIRDTFTTVFNANLFGANRYLWQFHSSADDLVHSATLRSSSDYSMLGCAVYFEGNGQSRFFPRKGEFDECQVDKSGKWLLIKENVDGKDGEDNRIINLETGHERVLLDRDGAGGHSDLGYGYMIATDNWASAANTQKLWNFNAPTLQGKVVYHNEAWQVSAPDHISHTNSRHDEAPEQQYACGSSLNQTNAAHANEIICFGLDGSNQTLVVAPVLSSTDGGDSYNIAPKGNLDPTGRYFIWSSNTGGSRMDVFLVKVPGQLLDGKTGDNNRFNANSNAYASAYTNAIANSNLSASTNTNPGNSSWSGSATTSTGSEFSPLRWNELANVTTGSDGALVKSGGCDGCADALAESRHALTSGNMALEFAVTDTMALYFLGVSQNQNGIAYNQLDHALRIQSGHAEVREEGGYLADIDISSGDRLGINAVNGRIEYSHNGTVFYTSTQPARYPLRAYATLLDSGSNTGEVSVKTLP